MLELAKQHKNKKILYIAFNKSLIIEIKDKHNKSNFSKVLPPTPFGEGARVNYYNNADYLLQFDNQGNMLY